MPARVLRTRVADPAAPPTPTPAIEVRDGALVARCGGGGTLAVLALEVDGAACDARRALRRARLRHARRVPRSITLPDSRPSHAT